MLLSHLVDEASPRGRADRISLCRLLVFQLCLCLLAYGLWARLPEVTQENAAIVAHEEVPWLDVSVHEPERVQELHRGQHIEK